MALVRRADRVRTCVRCGDTWTVPARLARVKRAGRWQRGGLGADFHAWGRATPLFNEAIRQAISNANDRNTAADASDAAAATFDQCPNCGARAWTEHKERRRT